MSFTQFPGERDARDGSGPAADDLGVQPMASSVSYVPPPATRTPSGAHRAARPMPGTLHDGKRGRDRGQGVTRLWRWAALGILMPTFGLTVARAIDHWPSTAGEARTIMTDVVRRPGETLAGHISAIAGPLVDVPGDVSHASLSLRCTPAADVWIDGKPIGRTPVDALSISLGPHEVRFHRDGYPDRVHEVVATRAQPMILAVDLTHP